MYPAAGQGGCSYTGNAGGATVMETPTETNANEDIGSAANASPARAVLAGERRRDLMSMMTSLRDLNRG
jgi:hypothetical protein